MLTLIMPDMNITTNKQRIYRNLALPLLSAMLVLLASCDRSRMDKGFEYFPDMAHSAAYETYSEHPVLPSGKSMLLPPEGSIPVDYEPYTYGTTPEAREQAGKALRNPFTPSAEVLTEGKKLYEIFCQQCHGATGAGDGFLYLSKKYSIKPSSLITNEMKAKPGGEIYHVITKGWGVMGAHGSLINPSDRWKIVTYVEHTLQEKQ